MRVSDGYTRREYEPVNAANTLSLPHYATSVWGLQLLVYEALSEYEPCKHVNAANANALSLTHYTTSV